MDASICGSLDVSSLHGKSLQLCLTFCDSMDMPVSSVHGILQARILEWVAMPFSRASSQSRDQTQVSCLSYLGSLYALDTQNLFIL